MKKSEINDYIRKHYEKLDDITMSAKCGISANAVGIRRQRMGLLRDPIVREKKIVEHNRTASRIIHLERENQELRQSIENMRNWKLKIPPRGDSVVSKDGITKLIVISDMQIPYHDTKTMSAVEAYMADETWHYYLNIGDFMDFDFISSFNKNDRRMASIGRFHQDYAIANEILDRHQSIVRKRNPGAEFILLEGNHEERVQRYLDENPHFTDFIEVDKNLKLEERGFKWVKSWSRGEIHSIGKANFTHGQYTNQHHAAKMVNAYGDNIFYGHTHDVMSYSKVQRGDDKTIVGQSLGCLCDYSQSYMQGRPSNWQQAFGVFYFMPDGFFTYYVPRIFNHQFVAPNGKLYKGV